MLVNGSEIMRTIKGGGSAGTDGGADDDGAEEGQEEPREVRLQVITQNPSGETTTTLDVSEDPCLFIQAWCEEVGKGLQGGATETIQFALESGHQWASLTPVSVGSGVKTARIDPSPTMEGDTEGHTVGIRVSAVLEGQAVSALVQITVVQGDYIVRIY